MKLSLSSQPLVREIQNPLVNAVFHIKVEITFISNICIDFKLFSHYSNND